MDSSFRRDDGLPEVVPDTSPEVLSQAELYRKHGFDGGEGKFPYVFDSEGHKYTPLRPLAGNATELPSRGLGDDDVQALGSRGGKKICGVRRKTFWILISVAVLVVITIAIGAGVGASSGSGDTSSESGSQEKDAGSSQASSSGTTAAASSSASSTDTASPAASLATNTSEEVLSATSSATSSAPEATPTFLNNQTAPSGFAFQGFSGRNYGGEAGPVLREEGFIDLIFHANSYVWLRNGTACCLTFCQGTMADVGYWCDDRRQTAASVPFDRVYIWCDQDYETEMNKCSRGD